MRFTISIILFLSLVGNSFNQPNLLTFEDEKRLYTYIKESRTIESERLGLVGLIESKVWKRADSLFRSLSLQKTLQYFQDSSYAVKYYTFLRLVYLDELKAFDILKASINDTTKPSFTFYDYSGHINFNQLITDEYGDYLVYKYKRGWQENGERKYFGDKHIFLNPDSEKWVAKYQELNSFLYIHDVKYKYQ